MKEVDELVIPVTEWYIEKNGEIIGSVVAFVQDVVMHVLYIDTKGLMQQTSCQMVKDAGMRFVRFSSNNSFVRIWPIDS